MQEWTYLRQDTTQTRQVDTPKESRTFIYRRRSLYLSRESSRTRTVSCALSTRRGVRVHARSVLHEAESSRPSCCADDTAPGTPDDLCRHTHSAVMIITPIIVPARAKWRRRWRPFVISPCGAANPEGNGAIGMVNDCQLARPRRGESRLK
jgi:hypothetical protein